MVPTWTNISISGAVFQLYVDTFLGGRFWVLWDVFKNFGKLIKNDQKWYKPDNF